MGAGHSSEGLVPRAALCIPPPAAPEQGGQDTSLARMLGAAWGKEGNLKFAKVRVLVRNEVFLPPRFWQLFFSIELPPQTMVLGSSWIPAHPVSRRWTDVFSRTRVYDVGDSWDPKCPLLRERLGSSGSLNFVGLPLPSLPAPQGGNSN